MKYFDVIFTSPAEDWLTDLLMQELADIGFESFEKKEDRLHAFLPQEHFDEDNLKALLQHEPFGNLSLNFEVAEAEDKNWNEEWEKNYFKPTIVMEGELAVRAPFHKPVEGVKHELIIDPKMAFGTGNHGTTQAMLTLMSQINMQGATVIDMGAGSGILGIYAMLKGARQCTSIDIDDWCISNAADNAELNGVKLDLIQGDAEALRKVTRADIFLANINRNIILNDLDMYVTRMHPSGIMLLSGFLIDDLPMIMDAVSKHGLTHSGHLEMPGGWVALRVTNQMP